MVVNGLSTRKVARITEELCGTHALHRPCLELCKDLDVSLRARKERGLSKTLYPFLILDGIVIKVREDGKVRPFSLLVAKGINQEGYREILGMELGNSETEESWSNFFKDLKARGLRGVDIVISDNLQVWSTP
ncbi:MAG: transposase, partial [Acetomicrobium sp.]